MMFKTKKLEVPNNDDDDDNDDDFKVRALPNEVYLLQL